MTLAARYQLRLRAAKPCCCYRCSLWARATIVGVGVVLVIVLVRVTVVVLLIRCLELASQGALVVVPPSLDGPSALTLKVSVHTNTYCWFVFERRFHRK